MEFLEKVHVYLNDYGQIIPSVTQLISWKFGSGYDEVPEAILKSKAEYGTRIHALIEEWHKTGKNEKLNPQQNLSMMAYKDLAKNLPNVVGNEIMCCFDNRLAGTLDLLYEDGSIGDIKTYATLDEKALFKLKWQISLYLFCYYGEKMNNHQNNHLIWLPKSMKYAHKLIEGIYSYEECLKLLEEYEKEKGR